QPPSREVRLALVEQFALERGIPLSHAAAEALATNLPGAREIDAALMSLELATQAEGRAIASEDVENYVQRLGRPAVELKKIAAETARQFAVKVADLRGASRRQSVAAARALAMSLARELTDHSLRQIGDYFGGRDHTTVLHACRQAQSRLDDDPQTAQVAATLKRRLVGA
ncbi:MAG TPA: helix-turn-helix domain-containing protein, partial [Pirellulales bacterium]